MQSSVRSGGSTSSSQTHDVNASAGALVASTLGAAAVAGAILTFVWLPAEYGIDPTGAGHLLGLTEMGEIKEQLHADADADAAASANNLVQAPEQTTLSNEALTRKLDDIQLQLTAISSAVGAGLPGAAKVSAEPQASIVQTTESQTPETQLVVLQTNDTQAADTNVIAQSTTPAAQSIEQPVQAWQDELEYTLTPGEGIEIKLVMQEGAVAEFEWSANGAVLNHDTHGDGSGQSISYEKGRGVSDQTGKLVAAFTGNHGWFWRNRTENDVVVSVRTRGEYSGMVLP